MTARQLSVLESGYLMALCVMDWYKLQGNGTQRGTAELQPQRLSLSAPQYACTQGLDWTECEELTEWLVKRGILNADENRTEHRNEAGHENEREHALLQHD